MNADAFQITATVSFSFERKDIEAIINGALNGCGFHWYSHAEVVGEPLAESEGMHLALGGTLRFVGKDGYGSHDLSLDAFLKGVRLFAENEFTKEIIYGRGIDCGLTDEFAANDIIEYALFGDLLREGGGSAQIKAASMSENI